MNNLDQKLIEIKTAFEQRSMTINELEQLVFDFRVDIYALKDEKIKSKYINEIKNYQKQLEIFQREELINKTTSQNEKSNADMLEEALDGIRYCQNLADNSIKPNLDHQGNQIKNMKTKLDKMQSNISKSNSVLNKMKGWWKG